MVHVEKNGTASGRAFLFAPAGDYGVIAAIITLSISVILIAGGLILQQQIRTLAAELPVAAIEFEREIGYGGLIHHFKNYVLRPDETEYRDAALQSADNALIVLERMDRILTELGMPSDETGLRETIVAYQGRIATVERLHAEGKDSQAIDEEVRVDDASALTALGDLKAAAYVTVDARIARLTLLGGFAGALFAASSAALVLAFLKARRAQRRVATLRAEAVRQTKTLDESEQARREAEAAVEELRAFSYAMSHDLKAPANTLTVLVNELFYSMTPTPDQREIMDMCLKTLDRMKVLIGDLLGYAGLVHEVPKEDWVCIGDVIANVQDDLAAEIEKRGAVIHVAAMPDILANKSHLHMLFQNLMGNALCYSRDDIPPEIRIAGRVTDNERWFAISVTDNGIGISRDNHRRVFELFKRLHRQDERPGTGLGLTICRRIALNLGGQILLESAEGQGSTFILTVPIERVRLP